MDAAFSAENLASRDCETVYICIRIRLGLAIVPWHPPPFDEHIGAPFERYDTLRMAPVNCC